MDLLLRGAFPHSLLSSVTMSISLFDKKNVTFDTYKGHIPCDTDRTLLSRLSIFQVYNIRQIVPETWRKMEIDFHETFSHQMHSKGFDPSLSSRSGADREYEIVAT